MGSVIRIGNGAKNGGTSRVSTTQKPAGGKSGGCGCGRK